MEVYKEFSKKILKLKECILGVCYNNQPADKIRVLVNDLAIFANTHRVFLNKIPKIPIFENDFNQCSKLMVEISQNRKGIDLQKAQDILNRFLDSIDLIVIEINKLKTENNKQTAINIENMIGTGIQIGGENNKMNVSTEQNLNIEKLTDEINKVKAKLYEESKFGEAEKLVKAQSELENGNNAKAINILKTTGKVVYDFAVELSAAYLGKMIGI